MKNISRESQFTNSFTILFTFFLNRGACFTFLIVPAMFFSCINIEANADCKPENQVHPLVKSQIKTSNKVEILDAFVFDQSGKLDCYQRFEAPDQSCEIASGSGVKHILLVANSNHKRNEWITVRNLMTMADIYVGLEDERHDSPVMTSLFQITAGEQTNIDLLPIRSEIRINSLRCDFSDEAYHNERLTDIKIYLTNVNANCSILPDEDSQSSRFINIGMLDIGHLNKFAEHDMITQNLDIEIGNNITHIHRSLFCYANRPIEESIGSPVTKLVIEGKIGGNTYYYPIKINPRGGGVARGCRYIFDIVLTRAGITDPDGELNEEDIDIIMEVEEWKEKDGYAVSF